MKKRILSLILSLVMVFGVFVFVPAATLPVAATYTPTDTNVYIGTAAEFKQFRDDVNAGYYGMFANKNVYLTADIDISDASWKPIGNSGSGKYFKGNFDGQGHTITGLNQTYNSLAYSGDIGLFGYISPDNSTHTQTIKNFKLARAASASTYDIYLNQGFQVGGTVVSRIRGVSGTATTVNISGIWSDLKMDASNNVCQSFGGIVGAVDTGSSYGDVTLNIDSCCFSGFLNSATGKSIIRYGGILGIVDKENSGVRVANITNCLVTATIKPNNAGADDIGGIVGFYRAGAAGKIENCIFAGTIWNAYNCGVIGYVLGEITGTPSAKISMANTYYAANYTTNPAAGGYGYGSNGNISTYPTEKTMDQLKALTSGFSDNSKWHFGTSSELPLPDILWDMFSDPLTSSIGSYYVNNTVSIGTAAQLRDLATRSKQSNRTFSGKIVSITANIDLSGSSWSGIGNGDSYPFMGSFYGNNHTINYAQTLSNTDGTGGLINMLRTPNGGTVTVKDLKVTGTITSTSTNSAGYYATVVSMVDAGKAGSSGATGTINIQNIWSTVNVNQSGTIYAVGGIVGYVRHAVSTPLTLNIDSCVYSGTLNFGNQAAYCGGILGYSGHNAGTRNVNITNCLVDGQISLNDIYSNGIGLIVGRVNGTSGWYGVVTYNIKDCIATGKFTFYTKDSRVWDINKDYGMVVGATYNASGTYQTTNITNVYYQLRSNTLLIPAYGAANHARLTATDTNCCVEGNFTALTAANCGFTTPSKWKFTANTNSTEYYPVPASIYTSFSKSITRDTYAHMTVSQQTGYKSGSVRFTATFYNTAGSLGITNIGSNNVNCGVILVPLSSYSASSTDTVAGLTSLTKAKQVKAFKFTEPSSGVYQVDVVLCNYSSNSDKQGNDYMAFMYYGNTVISGCIISYNRLSAGHI